MNYPTDPIALAQALIRCPSVTPQDGGALLLVHRVLDQSGFAVSRMVMREEGTADVENLYARIGEGAPNLCFAGHLDVVPPGDEAAWSHAPFSGDVWDRKLYGRGAADMKGAVACFIAAAVRHLAKSGGKPQRGSISLLLTCDEEGPAINGTVKVLDWLKANGETLDACVVGEPTNPAVLGEEIKIGRRGSLNGELVSAGKQGHAAYPHLADNPVPKLARIIDRLSSSALDEGSAHFEPSSLQTTVITVPNTATNVIPSEARALFNVRYNDNWTRETLETVLRSRVQKAAEEIGARYELTFSGTGTVFLTQPGPLVETMAQAVQSVTGKSPKLTTGGGTSDARFIQAVCPVIEFGLVNATIHQVDEHVAVNDLIQLTEIYERFIRGYFASAA